jgi:hypothetical protein
MKIRNEISNMIPFASTPSTQESAVDLMGI